MSYFDERNSYFSDRGYEYGDFVLSKVSQDDLRRHGIDMTVKDFKRVVEKSRKYKVILTGGGLNYRHTRVYNFKNFKNIQREVC